MASPRLTSSLLIISILLSASIVSGTGGFSVDLIHRDSPLSPYYNPSTTTFDRIRSAAARATTHRLSSDGATFSSEVIFDHFEYLMTLYLGTPAHKILAIADTGSDVTWTQCKPCDHCMNKTVPLFDPASSSTYRALSCNSQPCQETASTSCSDGKCLYQVVYGDQSTTIGDLSTETFGFDSAGRRKVSIPKLVFGCAHETKGNFHGSAAGLVGLGRSPSSLISQLGSSIGNRFSYCLVSTSETSATSQMNFGDAAVVAGSSAVSTPLIRSGVEDNSLYWLSLQGIGVDGATVQMTMASPSSTSSSSDPNIIIDSGTTLTYLPSDLVLDLEKKLSGAIKLTPAHLESAAPFSLCYKADGTTEGIPNLTFKFDGASVTLSPQNTFVEVEDGVICLAIVRSDQIGTSIYGNVAQQNFHIGYDLEADQLYFAPADCSKL